MSPRPDGHGVSLPSLDATYTHDEVTMNLTSCGLLVENAEILAQLYAQHRDWTVVEERWLEERFDQRSTRGSSKKIYRILSGRFKTATGDLPSIATLPSIFEQCETTQEKAQVLYFYLLEEDPLVKYVVHRYVDRLVRTGVDGLDFSEEPIHNILNEFHYEDGTEFDYADSTSRRWEEGFRSVMRDIDVLESQQSLQGEVPTLGTIPLLVASGYSWEQHGEEWLSQPTGWLYLFQPEQYWNTLVERVSDHPSWEASKMHGELRLSPTDDTYGWADPWEGEI
jgi:hypothetical protein